MKLPEVDRTDYSKYRIKEVVGVDGIVVFYVQKYWWIWRTVKQDIGRRTSCWIPVFFDSYEAAKNYIKDQHKAPKKEQVKYHYL